VLKLRRINIIRKPQKPPELLERRQRKEESWEGVLSLLQRRERVSETVPMRRLGWRLGGPKSAKNA
jgi:hypothetical protein